MTKTKTFKTHEYIKDMSSEEYHGTVGTFSSSQFKDLLDDETIFIKKYILKEVEKEDVPAFDVGTYFHTGILEPHKLKDDCVVYPGKIRRGKEWDTFKEQNKDKVIVTQSQKDQAEGLIKCVRESVIAKGYLDGEPEVSLFTKISIHQGNIYAPHFKKRLTPGGWVESTLPELSSSYNIVIKVRSDTLGKGYISDLKSTTGNAVSERSMRGKISDYSYDLSAALYLDMFSLMNPILADPIYKNGMKCSRFAWIFASKDFFNSKTYLATDINILVGRSKYTKALLKMKTCADNNWQIVDSLGVLDPLPHELEHLKPKDTDLL